MLMFRNEGNQDGPGVLRKWLLNSSGFRGQRFQEILKIYVFENTAQTQRIKITPNPIPILSHILYYKLLIYMIQFKRNLIVFF